MAEQDADLATDYADREVFLVNDLAAKFAVDSVIEVNQEAELPEVFLTELGALSNAGDGLPPVVVNFTPSGELADKNTPIEFDVTDVNPGIALVLVSIQYAPPMDAFPPQLVYSGSQFEAQFASLSTKVAIADGFRFSLLPVGGWPANITNVWVYSADLAGEVGDLP